MAWSGLGTEKARGERFNLGHDRLSNAGGGIERLLNPPDEHRRIHPTAPAIRLDAMAGFAYVDGASITIVKIAVHKLEI